VTLTRLSLTDFRSYANAGLSPGPGFVVLTGENGAGKTNILEAVSLLAPGRGLRRAALSEMARTGGSGGFSISAKLGEVTLGTGSEATAPDRRRVRINGATHGATALSEWLSIVWLTPAMDRLFVDGAAERRSLLDRLTLALEPQHGYHSTRYEAAMRQRNRLLTEQQRPDADWLTALESQMAEHGAAIAHARSGLVAELDERLGNEPDGPFARAQLAIAGWNAADGLAGDLQSGRVRDKAAGRTLIGPHRSDLSVTHRGKDQPAARCSTGEQKALLLAIVLAHADLVAGQAGRRPVLLLDEIAAHLDPVRRAALFERLQTGGGQVWMTGTEQSLFSAIGTGASRFLIDRGHIQPD
jgi:DNA replication and repair protein RecF